MFLVRGRDLHFLRARRVVIKLGGWVRFPPSFRRRRRDMRTAGRDKTCVLLEYGEGLKTYQVIAGQVIMLVSDQFLSYYPNGGKGKAGKACGFYSSTKCLFGCNIKFPPNVRGVTWLLLVFSGRFCRIRLQASHFCYPLGILINTFFLFI